MNRSIALLAAGVFLYAITSGCGGPMDGNPMGDDGTGNGGMNDGNAGDGDNGGAGGGGSADAEIPETTKVLASADIDALQSPGGDLSRLIFTTETAAVANLNTDDVVVCGVHEGKLPYGMLRKVSSITRQNGQIIVDTEQATLTEAIESGSIDETFTLTPESNPVARNSRTSTKIEVLQQSLDDGEDIDGFIFAFNDYELYDADGNPATREDRVWAEGNFAFAPTIGFRIDIDGFELDTLTFEVGSEQQASIRVEAGRSASFDEVEVLETIELTPIAFSIGPVPVILVPRIALRVGVDGMVTADLVAGVQTDATVRIGFGYQNGSFEPISEFNANAGFDTPQFRDGARGTARVWAGPRAELAAYGVAGVYGELRGFVVGEVDTDANPWWVLSAGVEALAGVFIQVFDATIADYATDPIGETFVLADAGGPAPSESVEVITWARSFSGDDTDLNDNPVAIIETDDGGSILVAGTNSFTGSGTDTWIIKLDELGQVSWQQGIEDISVGIGIAVHPDGGYVVLSGSVGTGADEFQLTRIDVNGDVLWSNNYTAAVPIGGYGLLASGSDFIVGGLYGSGVNSDFLVTKVNDSGEVIWATTLGGDEGEQVDGFCVNADGSIVAAGPTHSFDVTNNGHFAAKFSSNGGVQWQRAFDGDGAGNEWIHSVVPDSQGNYRLVGRLGDDALVTKIDGNGNLLDAVAFDADSPFEEVFAGVAAPDDGLLIAGNTGLGSDADLWLMRISAELEVIWTTSYGGPERDEAGGTIQYGAVSRPLAATQDGGFLVLANTQSFGGSFSDIWVQKISGTGIISYDAGSNATRTALAGSFLNHTIVEVPTNVTPQSVTLTVTPMTVETYTPTPSIMTQATP